MIYLDYNATTPVHKEVVEVMLPYFTEFYGNSSSRTHLYGWDAREAVDKSRKQIADLLAVNPKQIVFTSGATESINLALKGFYEANSSKDKYHIISVKTEHKAVLDTLDYLKKFQNAKISLLDVDKNGNIDLQALNDHINNNTLLVAIMFANNETGVIHPIKEIGEICAENSICFFSDATQAIGKIKVKPKDLKIDLMAFSSHKVYGPKGVGGLYIDNSVKMQEQINGGQHERKRRSGTLNVPGIVGFGKAIEIIKKDSSIYDTKIKKLRDYLEKSLRSQLNNVFINGTAENRLSHVTNLLFKDVIAEDLMLSLSTHIALSSGSACNSASIKPSHVLKAMGFSDKDALSSIRFSLGIPTTKQEIETTIKKVTETVKRLRS